VLGLCTLAAVLAPMSETRAASASASAKETAELAAQIQRELPSARALADLFRLFERRADEENPAAIASVLDAAAASPTARADVRALALELRGQLALGSGQLAQARKLFDAVAPVRSWAVIGPFDNEGRVGFAAQFGPEKDGFDPKAVYPGKSHEVAWRTLPDIAPYGYVDLSAAIQPHRDATAYAATALSSPRTQAAIFHLGAGGAAKLWVNGVLVHSDPNQHPSRFDQRSFPVLLSAGENAVLLKIAGGSSRLGFSLRIADANDRPLPQLASRARAPSAAPSRAFAVPLAAGEARRAKARIALPRVIDAVDELREAAAKEPGNARAQEDLAILYGYRRPDDDTERLALHAQERAAAAAPGDSGIELRLAGLEDRDQNRRRAALERALSKHPQDPEVLSALAGFRLEKGEGWKALELATRAQEASGGSVETALLLARAQEAVGLTGRATALRLAQIEAHPNDARAQLASAQALRRLGRLDEARAHLGRSLQLRFDDWEARSELTSACLEQGDLEATLRTLEDSLALDPASLYARLRAAELLSQNDRTQEAEAAYAGALRLAPDSPDAHEALGRHRLRTKDDAGALAAFARSLSLKPQNPALRELLRTVRPEEPYAQPYLYDAAQLVRRFPVGAEASEDSEILSDLVVTRVFANGLSSRTRQLVVRALTARGVEQARAQSIQFSPDSQVVRVERARILRKDGTVIESKSEGERSLSEPWYGLYYDVRARVIGFPQLEPGDTLELVTRLDDAGTNFFADYFGDFAYLQGTSSKRIADYVLLGPPGRTFYAAASPLPGLVHEEKKLPDGGQVLRWTAHDVPRVVPEPSMPGSSELFAWVHVSTYRDWDSVGRFYWGLVKDQLKVTDDVRKAAQEATRGIPAADEAARIRAVYDFVVTRTRYVGLEFGINSFKPYPVETILNRRFGDCKDKASLMHAMLEAIGIDSRLALLRMKRLGGIDDHPASLAVFNHAILYVPKFDLFLDGTAEFHGSRELPEDDRGAEALIVEPTADGAKGSRFLRTPFARPQDNVDQREARIELLADGSAHLTLSGNAHGSWTAEARRAFEPPDQRRVRAEEMLTRGSWPGVKVTQAEVSDPHDIEAPFRSRIVAEAPAFATVLAGRLRFSPFGRRPSFVETWASLSRRALPVQLPFPQRTELTARVALPRGFVAALPEGSEEKGPQGSWSVRYEREDGQVVARLSLELRGGTLLPNEYGAFRAFLGRLDQALLRKVEAARGDTTALN
jgi:tetratricopeptide (TPR) repeat protein/transglutaminase-like putative cysteine protease